MFTTVLAAHSRGPRSRGLRSAPGAFVGSALVVAAGSVPRWCA